MGSNWLVIDNNFPTFTGQESLKEQVRLLHDFLPIMIESLKYQLNNLDSSNWNAKAMQTFQKDTTKELEDAVDTTDAELAQVIRSLEKLETQLGSLLERQADIETDVALLEKWKTEIQTQADRTEETVEMLETAVDGLERCITPEEDGATIGGEGQVIRLVGTVYLNGTLLQT